MVLMDVFKPEQGLRKEVAEEILRPPLAPSEKNILVSRRPNLKEIPSRYKTAVNSSSLSTPGTLRRCPSPNVTRVVPAVVPSCVKRAQSADRRRPSTPSTQRPSTPVHDVSSEIQSLTKRLPGARCANGVRPSGAMRSLCVSFQSDTFSVPVPVPVPVPRKEKPVSQASVNHTLKPSANVAQRQTENSHVQRKVTPERKRTPLRGRSASDHLENSRPTENAHDRVIDQHRWPRTGGKVSMSTSARNLNLTDKDSKTSSTPLTGRGVSPMRRLQVSDIMGGGLQKAQSEVTNRLSFHESEGMSSGVYKSSPSNVGITSNSLERAVSTSQSRRTQSMPIPGSGPPSQSRIPMLSSPPSRGTLSPSRYRSSAPFPSTNSMAVQSSSSSSVLSFIADYRRGKKGANHIEDAHQLRLLYNRYLQWRYANAQADFSLSNQRITAENTLTDVATTTSELLDSVTMKSINLQQLRQDMKLNLILTEQVDYLEDWALLEKEHSSSVAEAIDSLQACTLRLPVTTGAKVDIYSLKSTVYSAANVIQAMCSSICSLLSKVEETNCLVSELAAVTAQVKAVVYECADLLASTGAMQVEENSLRTHLIQLKQALRRGEQPIPIILTPV